MSVSRQSDFAEFLRVHSSINVSKLIMRFPFRALFSSFPVDAKTLASLRVPEDLRCAVYRRSETIDPVVSVIVPAYNRQHTLSRSLDSVLTLGGDIPIEVIAVDDGSTDETATLLKERTDSRITAVGLPRRHGATTARNVGVAIARAPVVSFLDSDDTYMGGRLSDPLNILACNPDVGVVISSFVARKGKTEKLLRLHERTYDSRSFTRLIARYVLPPSTSGLTIRRELMLACNGFNPDVRRMQDRDLLLRLAPLTNAATSAVVSWRKHWSDDGISSHYDKYYEALCEFVRLHPFYGDQELATRNYLVGRHLIALVRRGRMARAVAVYRHARTELTPRLPPLPLALLSYLATKWKRRKTSSPVVSKGRASLHMTAPRSRL